MIMIKISNIEMLYHIDMLIVDNNMIPMKTLRTK